MQEVDEGDGYSDDDLDALPVDTFQELQQNAIRSTQFPEYHDRFTHPVSRPVQLPGPAGRIADHGHFDNASNNSFIRAYAQQPSSDYGDFDDEMLDGEIFDAAEEPVDVTRREGSLLERAIAESKQREEFKQQRLGETPLLREYGRAQHPYGDGGASNLVQRHGSRDNGFENQDGSLLLAHEKVYEPHTQPTGEPPAVDRLQAQIQEVPHLRHALFLISMTDVTKSYFENVIISEKWSTLPMN